MECSGGEERQATLAQRLRRLPVETVGWIAQRLQMGSVAHVNTLLYHWR